MIMGAYKSFAVTVIGGDHIKAGKVCQDASLNGESAGAVIAVVADGHGSDNCFRSDRGAEFAVQCAGEGIRAFVEDHKTEEDKEKFNYWFYKNLLEQRSKEGVPVDRLTKYVELYKKNLLERAAETVKLEPAREKIFTTYEFENDLKERLIKNIVQSWHKEAADDFEKNPFREEELEKADEKHRKKFENIINKTQTSLISAAGQDYSFGKAYGATLITAAITQHYWFGIHIGDGRLTALYPDGSFDQPVPWDERCVVGGKTTSICDDDAYERARCYFSFRAEKPPPVAVFLCSDGVDDSFPVYENEKHLFKQYRKIAIAFAEEGYESTCGDDGRSGQLKDLATFFATKGKRDDTSIAGFIDMEAIKSVVPVWKDQIAKEEKEAADKKAAKEAEAAAQTKAAEEKAAKEAEAAAQKVAEEKAAEEKPARETQKAEVSKSDLIQREQEYKKNMSAHGNFINKVDISEGEKR